MAVDVFGGFKAPITMGAMLVVSVRFEVAAGKGGVSAVFEGEGRERERGRLGKASMGRGFEVDERQIGR
jgi:hypothetical protein